MADNEQDPLLQKGDLVRLEGMPEETGLEGSTGSLVKPVGKSKWVVSIDGKEKSSVVNVSNLRRLAKPKGPADGSKEAPRVDYHIVGTWDDWDPHSMAWNAEKMCFEYKVIIGKDASERFKFLVGGDWDACVFPSKSAATMHDGHEVCGPADGGVDAEWCIGLHQADQAKEGANFLVQVFLTADEMPKRVAWDLIGGVAKSDNDIAVSKPAAAKPKLVQMEDDVKPQQPRRGGWSARMERKRDNQDDGNDESEPAPPAARNPGLDEEAMLKAERQARLRLEKRLAGADSSVVHAITDGVGEVDPAEREKEEIRKKLYDSRRRFLADKGSKTEKQLAERAGNVKDLPNIDDLAKKREEDAQKWEVKKAALKQAGPGQDANATFTGGPSGPCMECGKPCATMLEAGGHCCSKCWQTYAEIVQEGWMSGIFCDGITAAQRARSLVNEKGYNSNEARRAVMDKYPAAFGKGTKPKAKSGQSPSVIPVTCKTCGTGFVPAFGGRVTETESFCKYCDPGDLYFDTLR